MSVNKGPVSQLAPFDFHNFEINPKRIRDAPEGICRECWKKKEEKKNNDKHKDKEEGEEEAEEEEEEEEHVRKR